MAIDYIFRLPCALCRKLSNANENIYKVYLINKRDRECASIMDEYIRIRGISMFCDTVRSKDAIKITIFLEAVLLAST